MEAHPLASDTSARNARSLERHYLLPASAPHAQGRLRHCRQRMRISSPSTHSEQPGTVHAARQMGVSSDARVQLCPPLRGRGSGQGRHLKMPEARGAANASWHRT